MNLSFNVFILFFVFHMTSQSTASEYFDKETNRFLVVLRRKINTFNNGTNKYANFNWRTMPPILRSSLKKWQLGRVSQKQPEIINAMRRKTKIYVIKNSTTKKILCKNNFTYNYITYGAVATTRTATQSTPSYIEFYYLDEYNEQTKQRDSKLKPNVPVISFRLKNQARRDVSDNCKSCSSLAQTQPRNHTNHYEFKRSTKINLNFVPTKTIVRNKRVTIKPFTDVPKVLTSPSADTSKLMSTFTTKDNFTFTQLPTAKSSVLYDRIKFFEMYDRDTVTPGANTINHLTQNNDDTEIDGNNVTDNSKILLRNVDQNINNYNKTRYEKKHDNYGAYTSTLELSENNEQNNLTSKQNSQSSKDYADKVHLIPHNENFSDVFNTPIPFVSNVSRVASWSEYPFAAVYIYEPTQTHCDAAGINPYWLVVSGACLSRRGPGHGPGQGSAARSALVAFCGASWRRPARVAYVKTGLVHPRYTPRDPARRHLYNIGLIEVASSMASSCGGWSPASLISHRLRAGARGAAATAVGWGLDRYGSRYSSDRPDWPLSAYEGTVHTDSCPGSTGYSKAKSEELDSSGASNVYCLALPAYAGEAADPAHGGLLLVGGKLTALYLQEERKPQGPQSAQYTGIWRLVPWVAELVREPEDVDSFSI